MVELKAEGQRVNHGGTFLHVLLYYQVEEVVRQK